MKLHNKALVLAIAAIGTVCISSAEASWNDLKGGYGVVSFYSTDLPKIIFLDQIRTYEASLNLGTNRSLYNSALAASNASKLRNVYPSGSNPTQSYDPTRGGTDFSRISTEGPMVWTHISKSAGVECLVNQTNCAYPSQIASSSTCSYNKVKVTASAELGNTYEKDIKVANVSLNASIGGGLSVTREWESGWQACQQEGSAHTCPPDQNLNYNAVNFATTEARSKYGWQRFTTSGSTFYFNDRYHATDVTFCEKTIGGTYIAGNYLFEPKVGRCNVYASSRKPSWERYERMPIPNTPSLQTIIPTCRTIAKAAG